MDIVGVTSFFYGRFPNWIHPRLYQQARSSLFSIWDIIAAMKLTLAEVEHIAHLARLELTQQEIEHYCQQLSAILEYAARLQMLDTSGIPPTFSVLPARSVLRADQPRAGLPLEEVLGNAPLTEERQFRVPPVLE